MCEILWQNWTYIGFWVNICCHALLKIDLNPAYISVPREKINWCLTQAFSEISESINWCGLCFCDFQFISIWHILRNFQGSAALGSLAEAILLETPENFQKFMILCKFHIFNKQYQDG